jgi:hypothetical protein
MFRKETQAFWYPYDQLKTYLSTQISYYVVSGTQRFSDQRASPSFVVQELPPNLDWHLSLFGREYEQNEIVAAPVSTPIETRAMISSDRYVNTKELEISFARPVTYQLVFPVILVGLVVLLGFLATINSINTFLQVSIAILFGIFGLRQVLLPSDIGRPTILDALILGLYLIFALILIYFSISTLLGKNNNSIAEPSTVSISTKPNHVSPNTTINKSASESNNRLDLLIIISLGLLFGWVLTKLKKRS